MRLGTCMILFAVGLFVAGIWIEPSINTAGDLMLTAVILGVLGWFTNLWDPR